MNPQPLIAEDVLLCFLDDDSGAIRQASTLNYVLAGSLLVDLALRGDIDLSDEEKPRRAKVVVTSTDDIPDDILRDARDLIARKPATADRLLHEFGGAWRDRLLDRLVERGFVRREEKKWLWVIPHTAHPATDAPYEVALMDRVRAALETDAEVDERTAAVVALLSAGDALPGLHPVVRWSGEVYRRGKAFERADWAASSVGRAVAASVAAITAAAISAGVAVSVAATSSS